MRYITLSLEGKIRVIDKIDPQPYSVLMSVYINEKPEYLKQAVYSMLNQSVAPSEIVIVEDGELTKELYDVINGFVVSFPDIMKIVVNEKNLGLGKSLARGLDECAFELVARMDSDDISVESRCEKQLYFLSENPNVDIVGTNISEFIGSVDNVVGHRNVPDSHIEICEFLKRRCPFNHVTVMFKKSAVYKAGGYLDWHYNEDYYLWIRMYLSGAQFANLDESLVFARVGREMYSRRGGKKYYESERNLLKFMYDNNIIDYGEYVKGKAIRFVVQRMMTNGTRQWFYKRFARS